MSNERPPRVAILFDGYVPEYRRRFYELLAQRPGVEYVVFWGRHPARLLASPPAPGPYRFPNIRVRNVELRLGRRAFLYQSLVRTVAFGDFDAVVVGARLRVLSNLLVATLLKVRRRPVIFWGHGLDQPGDVGAGMEWILGLGGRAKSWMVRRGDGYLAYTEGGRRRLIASGLSADRVFVVRNTLDTEEQARLHAAVADADPLELRRALGLADESVVFLYVASIYREKRVGELLEAFAMLSADSLAQRKLELVVLGAGPELEAVRLRAAGLPGVRVRGEVIDQLEVARYMRVAAAVVIPGGVGLAVNHAISQGRPLITRADAMHGPELEYLEHGRNGLVIGGGLDDFARELARFADSSEEQARLARGALASRGGLGIEQMAANFDRGVRAILRVVPGSGAGADGDSWPAFLAVPGAKHPQADAIPGVDPPAEPEAHSVGTGPGQ
jgi:glycosyltransferase involved in cell wall biosynthesis